MLQFADNKKWKNAYAIHKGRASSVMDECALSVEQVIDEGPTLQACFALRALLIK